MFFDVCIISSLYKVNLPVIDTQAIITIQQKKYSKLRKKEEHFIW